MRSAKRVLFVVVAVALILLLTTAHTAMAVSYDRPQATVYTIDAHEDGDATWTIELRYQLVGDEEVAAFESIREDFEQGNLSVFEGIEEDMAPFADEASEATGRPMSVSDFERDVYIRDTLTQRVGIVSVTFEWSGFAEASSSEVRVGDVFVGSGLALTENDRLVIEHVDDVPLNSVSPEPDTNDGDRLVWDGERFFEEGQPSVVFSEATNGGETGNGVDDSGNGNGSGDTDSPSTPPPTGSGSGPGGSSTATTVAAGIVLLVSGFAGGLYLGKRTGLIGRTEGESEREEQTEHETSGKELLTDEDRVVRILNEHGGKMKQAELVDETDWSKSKVSMLLSNMEEEEKISKLRLGRENVIELEEG